MTEIKEHLNGSSFFGVSGDLIATKVSKYQKIELFMTQQFGKVLVIDGVFMTSEGEEFIYHECMVHPAANAVGNVNDALIIGGGDGGIARELLSYNQSMNVTLAELDEDVVKVSREFLGIDRGALSSNQVDIVIGDGLETASLRKNCQDLVILDLTDPGTTANFLYSAEAVDVFKKSLRADGAMVMHLGSPVYHHDRVRELYQMLTGKFTTVRVIGAYIPLYGSYWLMAICRDAPVPNEFQHIKDAQVLKYLNSNPAHLTSIPKCHDPQNNGF